MTATSFHDEELKRVQILLEALATELERGLLSAASVMVGLGSACSRASNVP
jgi:hypothetical protein